jgi:TonB family protein
MFWLESDGRITAPQIVRGSGVPSLDLLALAAIKRITYKPPLVGRTPVRALMQQPFHF